MQQRKLVKELEIAYAKAEASGDKSAKTIHKELNKARRGLKSMQSETMSVADVLLRLTKQPLKTRKIHCDNNKALNIKSKFYNIIEFYARYCFKIGDLL